jgi:cytidine deaminase
MFMKSKYLFLFLPIILIANPINRKPKQKNISSKKVIKKALLARKNSYSPYSKYSVGSAIKTKDGKIFYGTNIENASYGMTICAERAAICSAVSRGEKDITHVVVATIDGKGSPCGACRQVLNEFNPDMIVILVDENGAVKKECKLSQLFLHAFGPKNLSK